jgi:hypothetical protein
MSFSCDPSMVHEWGKTRKKKLMIRRIIVLAASTLILGFAVSPNLKAQERNPDLKEVKTAGVSFIYNARDFAGIKIEKVQKQIACPDCVDDGFLPEHVCFNLKDKRPLSALDEGPRYFFPAYSFICVIPLKDPSVKHFDYDYPTLSGEAPELQKILRERPNKWKDRTTIPDLPPFDGNNTFVSKFQYLNFRSGSGILFLTQYSNEMEPNPVNNEELTLDFQGLTKDGRYYIAARLAITHPSLPRGIDFTDHIKRDLHWNYLKKEKKELDGFPEESFLPSLKNLKALLSSIHIE